MLINFYKIVGGEEEYIGSTARTLQERWREHKKRAHLPITCSSSVLFHKYGVENCRIELIETCECATKEERLSYEGELIRASLKCVNIILSGRTSEQYYTEFHDEIREEQKSYYDANREDILKQKREKHSQITREERDRRNAMARERRRLARLNQLVG